MYLFAQCSNGRYEERVGGVAAVGVVAGKGLVSSAIRGRREGRKGGGRGEEEERKRWAHTYFE